MKIINKTPHPICLVGVDGRRRFYAPTAPSVRVLTRPGPETARVDCVPVHEAASFSGIANLPPRAEETLYVVSQIAALAIASMHPERYDIVYPGTAPSDKPERRTPPDSGVLAVSRLVRAAA